MASCPCNAENFPRTTSVDTLLGDELENRRNQLRATLPIRVNPITAGFVDTPLSAWEGFLLTLRGVRIFVCWRYGVWVVLP